MVTASLAGGHGKEERTGNGGALPMLTSWLGFCGISPTPRNARREKFSNFFEFADRFRCGKAFI